MFIFAHGNVAKVHHEVGTMASNNIFYQGVVHIVTLEYCVAERDYSDKVDNKQRTGIGPASLVVVVVVDDDLVMVVDQHTCQLKTTAWSTENSRELGVNQ